MGGNNINLEELPHILDLMSRALVHDIGKVRIPAEIINKPGILTEDEWKVVKRHPVEGLAFLLRRWGISRETARMFPAVLEHHLGMSFSGYPEFMRRKAPGFLARIIHIADFYDAVTTPRVYNKSPFSPVEVVGVSDQSPWEIGLDPTQVTLTLSE